MGTFPAVHGREIQGPLSWAGQRSAMAGSLSNYASMASTVSGLVDGASSQHELLSTALSSRWPRSLHQSELRLSDASGLPPHKALIHGRDASRSMSTAPGQRGCHLLTGEDEQGVHSLPQILQESPAIATTIKIFNITNPTLCMAMTIDFICEAGFDPRRRPGVEPCRVSVATCRLPVPRPGVFI